MDELLVYNVSQDRFSRFGPTTEHVFYDASRDELFIRDSGFYLVASVLIEYYKTVLGTPYHLFYLGVLNG